VTSSIVETADSDMHMVESYALMMV